MLVGVKELTDDSFASSLVVASAVQLPFAKTATRRYSSSLDLSIKEKSIEWAFQKWLDKIVSHIKNHNKPFNNGLKTIMNYCCFLELASINQNRNILFQKQTIINLSICVEENNELLLLYHHVWILYDNLHYWFLI